MLPTMDLANYAKVKAAILQTLNLSPEAYQQRLREIEFGTDYHPCILGQKICLHWLRLEEMTKGQIIEVVMIEHYADPSV